MINKTFAAFTMGDFQRQNTKRVVEFKRGRDKQKRKSRSLGGRISDKVFGKDAYGRTMRAAGALGLAAAIPLALRYKKKGAINPIKGTAGLAGRGGNKMLPGVGKTTGMSRTESSVGAIGGKGRTGVTSEVNRVKPNYETNPMSYRNRPNPSVPSSAPTSSKSTASNSIPSSSNKSSRLEQGERSQKFWFKR